MKKRKPFILPIYAPPDFTQLALRRAPVITLKPVTEAGVAPDGYHGTSIFPEYFQLRPGEWTLASESRMDCAVVLDRGASLSVREFRHLRVGDPVVCGRRENGEDGILVHTKGFEAPERSGEKFSFRDRLTRETSFSTDYDELYGLLRHERKKGFILWVLGPALAFDRDGREGFVRLVEGGYVHGLHAGNALATHDLEAALFGTALGQDIYSKKHVHLGHYAHLDAINKVRGEGSIAAAAEKGLLRSSIMEAVIKKGIPFVLAGSIRDDGPMPEVIGDVYEAQDRMRALARRATTVVSLATQLHAIAMGNMLPSYQVVDDRVRPVYFYSVDMSEFAATKLSNRGSLTARSILTNVQDFVVTVERGLREKNRCL